MKIIIPRFAKTAQSNWDECSAGDDQFSVLSLRGSTLSRCHLRGVFHQVPRFVCFDELLSLGFEELKWMITRHHENIHQVTVEVRSL